MIDPHNKLKPLGYCRKSSEDERQVASIGDQLRELSQLAQRDSLRLALEPFTEERTAKEPGRPVFNDMIRRIERGEGNMILCWDIDRLYRNPVDEGTVRWLLQRAVIKEIRTPFRSFYPHDAGLLMGVEGGRAIDHIITLRKGVFRGFRGKLERGHRPGVAPPGYLNNRGLEKGLRDVIKDPERFELVQRAWRTFLTNSCSVRDIERMAEKWALRSRITKKKGGKPYGLSVWYRIFTDPFYCGSFWWKEPGTDTRKLYKGAHPPMISQDEFDRVQLLLGRKGKPTPKTHTFAFTGLIRCGECRGQVTAETKHQIICARCKTKFSAPNKESCPSCSLPIELMEKPTRLSYTYYHCTKRKDRACSQRSVRREELERQVDEILERIAVSEPLLSWAIRALEQEGGREESAQGKLRAGAEQRLALIKRQLDYINRMILSPETDWELVSREEIKEQKLGLLAERRDLDADLEERAGPSEALELTERTWHFAAYARFWFREGDLNQRRAILAALGSNLTLNERKLALDLRKPLCYIADMVSGVRTMNGAFEPQKSGSTEGIFSPLLATIPLLCRGTNAIRTYWDNTLELTPLRTFLQTSPLFEKVQRKKRAA